jgi:hypothetical protein
MAFKWIQCRYCGHTMHFELFPQEEHRAVKRAGVGICRSCSHNPAIGSSLLVEHGKPFIDYLAEQCK